jgi:protein O-GlcNAc transferase
VQLADLFVDTKNYNAHTTACEALMMGVPVVTCTGETFSGRVAASLLNAVGLPELVTDNLRDYEALALDLAKHPEKLAQLRSKLRQNRMTHPLFDTAKTTRHIEKAYRMMWNRHVAGMPPDHLEIIE